MLEGDDLVLVAMDDEERYLDVWDAFDVWILVAGENRDTGDSSEGRGEGGYEHQSGSWLTACEPAGWAASDGLTVNQDIFGRNPECAGEMVPGGFRGLVAAVFGGFAFTDAVARVVIGQNAISFGVKGLKPVVEGSDILRVAVGPEQSGHSRLGGEVADADFLTFR